MTPFSTLYLIIPILNQMPTNARQAFTWSRQKKRIIQLSHYMFFCSLCDSYVAEEMNQSAYVMRGSVAP